MVFFFDIQKAFDSVPHKALMAKLQAGLNSDILGNYLTCRRKTVAVNGSSSSDSPVLSGVLGAPRIKSSATSFSFYRLVPQIPCLYCEQNFTGACLTI